MSHHHSEEPKPELKEVISPSENSHPFLSKNDLSLLTLASPFLSANGQKIISFFVNFNQNSAQTLDFSRFLNQLGISDGNKLLQELLPVVLGLLSKIEQGGLDPSLLTSLLGMMNNNTAPSSQEAANS